ncbi:MAG TPA: PPA1309 family protein [Jatrophihabitantaceae bacterium]|jgi:hypothetical protein|nr:PPA1309 family protein [Jatrophihabitantaceae bacterium]
MTAHLDAAAAEIESHVGRHGWDAPTALFALVSTERLASDDLRVAAKLGLSQVTAGALTPVEQEELPEGELDAVLAQITWPDAVAGCAVCQHIVMLPPSAEAELFDAGTGDSVAAALAHPQRREARLVAAVLRSGESAVMLRLRASEGASDDLLTGGNLAPNLVAALLATFD